MQNQTLNQLYKIQKSGRNKIDILYLKHSIMELDKAGLDL